MPNEIKNISYSFKKIFLFKIGGAFFILICVFLVNYLKNIFFFTELSLMNNIFKVTAKAQGYYNFALNIER